VEAEYGTAAMKLISIVSMFLLFPLLASAEDCEPPQVAEDNLFPSVKLETSMGDIVVELDRLKAPVTVNNFLRYVLAGKYDGSIFHRIEPDFVIQGGGYNPEFEEFPGFPAIVNESGNGLKNRAWTIAMARFADPHTATGQFYFNLAENTSLDSGRRWGYAVFGSVLEGKEVLTEMAGVETEYNENLDAVAVPVTTIVIKRATLLPSQF
jgi:peptidyl-prolyl cis-trans isomerase A (cyclophilin A)